MRVLNVNLETPIVHSNVKIEPYSGSIRLTVAEGVYIDDDIKYINKLVPEVIDSTFDTVLIGGLLLGLIPYYIQENKNCSKITVVEDDINNIQAIQDLNILSGSIEIINENFVTYEPTQSYDLIISDAHWGHPTLEPNWESEIETIKSKYANYLTPSGSLLVPLVKYKYTNI